MRSQSDVFATQTGRGPGTHRPSRDLAAGSYRWLGDRPGG